MSLDEDRLKKDIERIMGPWLDSLPEDDIIRMADSITSSEQGVTVSDEKYGASHQRSHVRGMTINK